MRWFNPILLVALVLAGCSDDKEAPKVATSPATTESAPVAAPAAPPVAEATTPAVSDVQYQPGELDQMLAPLALYPDALLAQVLMASTYPGNVADAVAWSKAHPQAKGDDAVRQVAEQPWDPSVQSLVAFPDVLATLGQDPAWVQKLGDAFLASPDAVMDSVQRLRRQARDAGNLQSNEQQTITVKASPAPVAPSSSSATVTTVQQAPAQTIVIEPADPQVVYVPSYNPSVVYGTWSYPSYPPAYYPPPPGSYVGTALATGLAFGAGVAIVNSLWGDCDWDDHDIDIDVHRYNDIHVNRRLDINHNRWQHDPRYRDGVPYRDRANRERFQHRLDGAAQRDPLRGRDPQAMAAQRERARQALNQHGIQNQGDVRQRVQQIDRERAQQALKQHGIEPGKQGDVRERVQNIDRERAQQAMKQHGIEPGKQGDLRERAQHIDKDKARQKLEQHGVHKPQNREQARNAAHKLANNPQARQKLHDSPKVRQAVRQQHAKQLHARDNAFAGARQPSKAHQQINRGKVSRAAAQRPHAARQAGHKVQRPHHMPARGGLKRH